VAAANRTPGLVGVFTSFNTRTPSVWAEIDRVKADMLGVTPDDVFQTLEVYLGSSFINEFNYLGRTYRVIAQADSPFRQSPRDIANLKARNAGGAMVPIGSVATFSDIASAYRVPRYNLYPAAEIQGAAAPGVSTGESVGNLAIFVFLASVVFAFLVLAAQYESWALPLAVILIVPMCLLAAVSGLLLRGMDVNILAQVGFIVLVGLAAKNAILIVEFARQAEAAGADRRDAAVQAARTRLRPILMTSLAFIFGVLPLMIAVGAGAEMRQALGTAVFFGMLGVTFFGLVFTPTFYVALRGIGSKRTRTGG
jgi:multidrug efflux pump subunit AcrB